MVDRPAALENAASDDDIEAIGRKALFGAGTPGAAKFALPPDAPPCDVVMKGGVTSGVVYPYAVLRLAQKFRLAGIGGTSAGAIAAALTAAAEYARQGRGDPSAFSRFEQWCVRLPQILHGLFQPHRRHRPIFAFATAMMEAADSAPALATRLRAAGRIFIGPAGAITWPILLAAALVGPFAAIRYIWHYGTFNGRTPDLAHINPGLAAFLLAAAIGLASGMLLIGLFALALGRKRRWPMWTYLLFLAGAAAVSVSEDLGGLYAVAAPAALGGAMGVTAAVLFLGDRIVARLRETDFGLCPGLTQAKSPPALVDWLYAAIQDVAGRPRWAPLTFGQVEAAGGPGKPRLALRMIVTNLTLRRPYALPDFGGDRSRIGWRPSEWEPLFPKPVIDYLMALDPDGPPRREKRPLPSGADLPVIVGARMSLSFPLLFSAVPIYDLGIRRDPPPKTEGMSRRKARAAMRAWERRGRMLVIDGGLSSNMPLHFFDNLGPPAYPTFAFNLEDDPYLRPRPPRPRLQQIIEAEDTRIEAVGRRKTELELLAARRIRLHGPRKWVPRLRRMPDSLLRDYLGGLLGAAKDWQDNLLSIMPGQFDRIVTIRLAKGEGGLNLVMPQARSELLMQLGYLAGRELAEKFDLSTHQVRRALAAYQELERAASTLARTWKPGQLKRSLRTAAPPNDSAQAWNGARDLLIRRLRLLAWVSKRLRPPIANDHFPRPRGALRITPNLSGDI